MRRFQVPVSVLLAYATYLTVKCPCNKTLSCHKGPFFLSVGVASAMVAYENGML